MGTRPLCLQAFTHWFVSFVKTAHDHEFVHPYTNVRACTKKSALAVRASGNHTAEENLARVGADRSSTASELCDEEVYEEHNVTDVLQNPYVLMSMVVRGVENYKLLDKFEQSLRIAHMIRVGKGQL